MIKTYKSSDLPAESNKYTALYSDLAQYFRPFEYPDEDRTNDVIGEKYVNSNLPVETQIRNPFQWISS